MKVLFTTPVLEHPPAGGPALRIENSIKALSIVCELHIVTRHPRCHIGGIKAELFYRRYCKQFNYTPSVAGLLENRYLRQIQKIKRRFYNSHDDVDYILNYVDMNKIDIVWFGYGNISFSLIKEIKQIRKNLKVVCDTDSVWSRYILRELPYETDSNRRSQIENEGREKEKEEKEWVNLCEITTAVSEVDADYYRKLSNKPDRVKIFSNVIDLNNYRDIPKPPPDFKKPCMYLAGTFWPQSPMEKAARWMISEVMPIVKKTIPDIHFYIVGKGSKETLSDVNNPSITITGKLSSVLQYLCHADVSVVPLKFESGTRFKILEAGACGIPIVSTSLGAEGIPVTDGVDIIIADGPDEFSQGIVKIIQDKEFGKKIANNCKCLVQDCYSIELLSKEAKEILKFIED